LAEGKAIGALTIYSREPDPFSDDEVKLLTDLTGDLAYGISVLRLRSAHARAEQTLRESEEHFRTLAESIPHAVWVAAPDGRVEYANQLFLDYRGLRLEEVRDWHIWKDGVHPEDLAGCERTWNDLIRTGADAAFEYRLRRANDGAYRWQLGHGVAVGGQDGRVSRLIGTITDIHNQKMADEAARQAQKLESIGLLAGGIAHDFNNLLTGVIGYASMAEEMLPPASPLVNMMRHIVRAGEQAAHLTSQMLAYAGKGRFVVKPVNLSDSVRETSTLIQSSISKKITLRLELQDAIPAVESDPSQVQQVFMNLAMNAGEAIGDNPGVLSISTGAVSIDAAFAADELDGWSIAPGEYVFLEVRDTGCGMDTSTRARIFDPFFTTKFQGRGLGLAAVAGIVRAHRGAIRVATTPGAGTTFRVLFPALPVGVVAEEPSAVQSSDLHGRGTILVVDDEQVVRDVARQSLERQGYQVMTADSGLAAVQLIRSEAARIRLVVLDLSMPGMGGEETLPLLRDIKPDLEVIVSSGYSETETLRLFHGARVSGFIHKPYTAQELARHVKSVLEPVPV
jgi:PAS domain S-box-containing protein